MPTSTAPPSPAQLAAKIRREFAAREDRLEVFELFSGTATPGRDGTPDMPAPGEEDPAREDPGLSVRDSLAIGSFTALGLTGVSYAVMRYSKFGPVEQVLEPMWALGKKINMRVALEAAQQGENLTKLMELMPYVGTTVRRMNITAVWKEVEDAIQMLDPLFTETKAALDAADRSLTTLHNLGKAGFYGFGTLSVLGGAATALTTAYGARSAQILDEFEHGLGALQGGAARTVEDALQELQFRNAAAFGELDGKLLRIERLSVDLPDAERVIALVGEAEALFAPITRVSNDIRGLVAPYEDFLDVAQVLGAPIEGVLRLFEAPPKVLPAIIDYKTLTPGFWLGGIVGGVWVPPVRTPVWGFKEIFDPIPRTEVQKIIDLVTTIAGLPMELLEKALAPILSPLQDQIDKILQPIIDTLNPFDDYLDDLAAAEFRVEALGRKLAAMVAEFREAVDGLGALGGALSPVEEIGRIDPDGMATYFGTRAAERITGLVPDGDGSGGFMSGALLAGNGGADTLIGTRADDLLSGGAAGDTLLGGGGDDLLSGGSGGDLLHGGQGHDALEGGGGGDRLLGGAGNDTVSGAAGNDALSGNAGNDALRGGTGADLMAGGTGNDRLWGGAQGDTLAGGGGADVLYGQGGNDVLIGGAARDLLVGGGGADMFVFQRLADTSARLAGSDLVRDFQPGLDRVNLRMIDATPATPGDDAFHWLGRDRGFGTAPGGEIFYRQLDRPGTADDVTLVYLDTDADPAPEALIRLKGLVDLGADDFLL